MPNSLSVLRNIAFDSLYHSSRCKRDMSRACLQEKCMPEKCIRYRYLTDNKLNPRLAYRRILVKFHEVQGYPLSLASVHLLPITPSWLLSICTPWYCFALSTLKVLWWPTSSQGSRAPCITARIRHGFCSCTMVYRTICSEMGVRH